MADETKLDPMAAQLAAEIYSKTVHSLAQSEMPIPAWVRTEIKEEVLHCFNCSYCNFGIDGLKHHMFSQHPGSAAVVSTCGDEEALISPDVTFFCVRKTCPHWSSICYVYEDHLMKCCPLPLDLTQEEKESLTATLRFLMNFHRRHTLKLASGFLHFVCSHPEGIPTSEYKAVSDLANGGLADNSELNHKDAYQRDDSPSCYDVSCNGNEQYQSLHDVEDVDDVEGERISMLMSTNSETDIFSHCAISTDGLDSRPPYATNDSQIKISSIEGGKGAVVCTHKQVSNVLQEEASHIISKHQVSAAYLFPRQNSDLMSPTTQIVFNDSSHESQKRSLLRESYPPFRFDSSHPVSTKQASKPPAKEPVTNNVITTVSGPKFQFDWPNISQSSRPPADQHLESTPVKRFSCPLESKAVKRVTCPIFRFDSPGISLTPSKSNKTHQYSRPRICFSSVANPPVSINSSSQKAPRHNAIRHGTIIRNIKALPQNILQILNDKNCKLVSMKMANSNVNTQKGLSSCASTSMLPKTASESAMSQVQVIILKNDKFTGTPTKSDVLSQITIASNKKQEEVAIKPSSKIPASISSNQNSSNLPVLSGNSLKSSSSMCEASSVKPAARGQIDIRLPQTQSTSKAQTSESVSDNSLKSSSSICEASSVKPTTHGQIDIRLPQTRSTSKAQTSESVVPGCSPGGKPSVNISDSPLREVKLKLWDNGLRMQFGSKVFYSCHICHRTYTVASIMERHMKVEHTNEYYKICSENRNRFAGFLFRKKIGVSYFTYISKADTDNENSDTAVFVRNKTLIKPGDGKPVMASSTSQTAIHQFKCTMCPAVFLEPMESIRHVKGHVRENPSHGLHLQEFLNAYKNNFQCPRKTPVDEKPIQCLKCKVRFRHVEHFNKHLKSHPELMKLKSICKSLTSNAYHIKSNSTHRKSHTKNRKSHAKNRKSHAQNGTSMKSQTDLKKSHSKASQKKKKRSSHLQFQCDICGRIFLSKLGFHQHLLMHGGVKPYKCNICDKQFLQKCTLDVHMIIHRGELPYNCAICNKGFVRECFLRAHVKMHTDGKCTCKVCNKEFSCKGYLTIHMRVHTGEKPFLCSTCGRRFSQRSSLNTHSRLHTGEKPYKCDQCEKRFVVRDGLIKHMRMHTGEKPYKCPVCGKAFRQSGNIKLHVQKFHKEENPEKDG